VGDWQGKRVRLASHVSIDDWVIEMRQDHRARERGQNVYSDGWIGPMSQEAARRKEREFEDMPEYFMGANGVAYYKPAAIARPIRALLEAKDGWAIPYLLDMGIFE
jgi:hypothetical protein